MVVRDISEFRSISYDWRRGAGVMMASAAAPE